ILGNYVEYIAGKRMKNLGIKHEFVAKNPLSWTDKYLKSGDLQEAPQEVEKLSYIIGGVKNDVADMSFDDFQF
ncbi:MAG: ribonucleoside-diphosphate reductase beta chain, partial [Mucilaginibacter sp.]|nr:ribonucleoside-diphosphate reductase beta chain [Mucilaginibacter sp.]